MLNTCWCTIARLAIGRLQSDLVVHRVAWFELVSEVGDFRSFAELSGSIGFFWAWLVRQGSGKPLSLFAARFPGMCIKFNA